MEWAREMDSCVVAPKTRPVLLFPSRRESCSNHRGKIVPRVVTVERLMGWLPCVELRKLWPVTHGNRFCRQGWRKIADRAAAVNNTRGKWERRGVPRGTAPPFRLHLLLLYTLAFQLWKLSLVVFVYSRRPAVVRGCGTHQPS